MTPASNDKTATPVPAKPETASLLVRTSPAGASVAVDGALRGTTPLTLRDLALGTKTLVISRAGYVPIERSITLTADRPSRSVDVQLTPVARTVRPTRTAASAGQGEPRRGFATGRIVGSRGRHADGHDAVDPGHDCPGAAHGPDRAGRLPGVHGNHRRQTRRTAARRRLTRGRATPTMNAILALEDGTWFKGVSAGARGETVGRSCFQHEHDGVSGSAHRSLVCGSTRHDDCTADWQLRHCRGRSRIGRPARRRIHRARPVADCQQLAIAVDPSRVPHSARHRGHWRHRYPRADPQAAFERRDARRDRDGCRAGCGRTRGQGPRHPGDGRR